GSRVWLDGGMLRMRREGVGRGKRYSEGRGVVEAVLRLVYAGAWPARLWERFPGATEIRVVRRRVAVLPRRARLRVAFASDLHLGPTTSARTLDAAFRRLSEAEPDLLVLGGDYVFLEATEAVARELGARVREVPAKAKVAVMGNHDLWTHHGRLEAALERAGVQVLVNASTRLGAPHEDVAVVGLDDPWTGEPDGEKAFAGTEGAGLVVAVCHSPGDYPHARGRGAALFLCGHTHGGQVALPGGRPVVLPGGSWARRWPHGVHEDEGTTVFVSRGVGGVEVPFRAWAPPDVGVFEVG
ncbi:MAG TPA: metallophosphoesterase, partial [Thermoanaerobaculia bacterium]|nr:metallophosphoesterase [Thermoanaerobaculia bacterium]